MGRCACLIPILTFEFINKLALLSRGLILLHPENLETRVT